MALGLLLWMTAFVAVGYVIRQFRSAHEPSTVATVETHRGQVVEPRRLSALSLLQIAPLVILAVLIWTETRKRPPDDGHGEIVAFWLISMVYAVAITAWPVRKPAAARFAAWRRTYPLEIVAVSALALAALILRVYRLDHYPWIYSGDEGLFGLAAREVIAGRLKDPFGTAFQAHPNLWIFLQAGVMRVFGDDVAGSRLLAALFGVAAIPMVYLYVRRHFGVLVAFTAAAFTAVFHFHIFMSRDAQNNITAPFFFVLALWLLDRVIDRWRPIDALLAGLAIGLSQYFYVANRVLIPIAVVYLGYSVLAVRPRTRDAVAVAAQRAFRSGVIIAGGFVLAFLPLGAYYYDHPETYSARIKIVSVFDSGWLDREAEATGKSTTGVLLTQFKHATLAPFDSGFTVGFYRVDFFDWPLAIAVAIGLAVVTLGCWQRRYFGLAVTYWALVVGLALTVGQPQSNRFAAAGSLLPILGAIGLAWITRYVLARVRAPMFVMWTVFALMIAVTAAWNIRVYYKFTDAEPVLRHSDINTLVANTFAYELKDLGAGYTIYYAGAPRMFYYGHPNLPFLAVGDNGIDVGDPWNLSMAPPQLIGPTIFFFIPERRSELAVVQQWFPDGELIDHSRDDGSPLFTEYRVIPAGGAA
jgi:hypothetical protein